MAAMKTLRLKVFFLLAAAMAVVAALDLDDDHNYREADMIMDMQSEDTTMAEGHAKETTHSLRGFGRFLAQKNKLRAIMTCDKAPRVCRLKNSPGRNCCNKKCVDLKTDGLNCGKCGRKCRYRQTCCMGTCVNTLSDKKNCGGCNKQCKKGGSCAYGLCNYA